MTLKFQIKLRRNCVIRDIVVAVKKEQSPNGAHYVFR